MFYLPSPAGIWRGDLLFQMKSIIVPRFGPFVEEVVDAQTSLASLLKNPAHFTSAPLHVHTYRLPLFHGREQLDSNVLPTRKSRASTSTEEQHQQAGENIDTNTRRASHQHKAGAMPPAKTNSHASPANIRTQLCWDYSRHQSVAAKIFETVGSTPFDEELASRLVAFEVAAMDRIIPHPNVVRLLEVSRASPSGACLVMEADAIARSDLMHTIASSYGGR